eukprot:scaffold112366_cov17-Tisochrysis_lutea.AAC.2
MTDISFFLHAIGTIRAELGDQRRQVGKVLEHVRVIQSVPKKRRRSQDKEREVRSQGAALWCQVGVCCVVTAVCKMQGGIQVV